MKPDIENNRRREFLFGGLSTALFLAFHGTLLSAEDMGALEPLICYAAALQDSPNAKGAAAFTAWLRSDDALAIFARYHYDPPGDAAPLRA